MSMVLCWAVFLFGWYTFLGYLTRTTDTVIALYGDDKQISIYSTDFLPELFVEVLSAFQSQSVRLMTSPSLHSTSPYLWMMLCLELNTGPGTRHWSWYGHVGVLYPFLEPLHSNTLYTHYTQSRKILPYYNSGNGTILLLVDKTRKTGESETHSS